MGSRPTGCLCNYQLRKKKKKKKVLNGHTHPSNPLSHNVDIQSKLAIRKSQYKYTSIDDQSVCRPHK